MKNTKKKKNRAKTTSQDSFLPASFELAMEWFKLHKVFENKTIKTCGLTPEDIKL